MTSGGPLLIILVEDHPLHGRLLLQALRARLPGSRTELYVDGLAALRRLSDRALVCPDLIVLDLELTGRTGHELLADRAGDTRLRKVPAAVVTSSLDQGDRDRSLALGASIHLLKPMDAAGMGHVADELAALVEPLSRR